MSVDAGRRAGALAAVAIALLVLAGSALDNDRLQGFGGSQPMLPITAAGLLLAAVALTWRPVLGAPLILCGLLAYTDSDVAVPSATCFALAGVALVCLGRRPVIADACALAVALIAALALIGALFGVPELRRGLSSTVAMALPTSLAMLALSGGILAANDGIARLARRPGPGGALVRRLAPAAIVLPVALAFASLQAEEDGLVDSRQALALLAAALIVTLLALVLATGGALERVRLREQTIIDATVDAVISIDAEGRVHDFNAAAERMFGYRREHARGRALAELVIPERDREAHRRGLARVAATGHSPMLGHPVEMTAVRADGAEFPAEITVARLRGEGPARFVGHVRDISERVEAERALRQLAAVVESSGEAIIVVDFDGTVADWNRAAERIYGYPRAQAIGRHIEELVIPPERRAEMAGVGEELLREGSLSTQSVHRRRDGSTFPAESTVSLIRDAAGEVAGYSLIARDISDRLEGERAVRHLAAIVESSHNAIFTFDLDGHLQSWNAGAARLFGYEAGKLSGNVVAKLSAAGEGSEQVREFFELLRRGETFARESVARRADGSEIHVAYTAFPIRDEHGATLAGGVIAQDVTEQRELEDALRQSQKLEAIGQLAGGIAHDFNNLMTVITGYGQLARARIAGGEGAPEMEQIERAAERTTELTRQLLAFSRRQRLDPVVLDLSEVARRLEPLLRRLIGEDIAIELRLAGGLPRVRADAGQLEQVVMNLAVNARDAMPGGGTLTIETRAEGDHVCLAVTDTGVGIEPDALPHVFEPFYTTKPVGEGTGLGLASVHGAVTQSGGHVRVHSEPGRGTTFEVLLPATSETAADEPEPRERDDDLSGRGTLLVCEDEDGVRALVELVLADAGYRVLSAAHPNVALEQAAAEAGPIDALVTDVIMPDMPGPELARRLLAQRPGLRTLFVSGYAPETVRERGNLPPGSAFIEKPFDRETLLRTLRELLDQPA